MKYPTLPQDKSYRISIPLLNGGINTHMANTQIEDNQLSDTDNFWWKSGSLRTRYGTQTVSESIENIYPRDININTEEENKPLDTRYTKHPFYDGGRYAEWIADVQEYWNATRLIPSGLIYSKRSYCRPFIIYADGEIVNIGGETGSYKLDADGDGGFFMPMSSKFNMKAYYFGRNYNTWQYGDEWAIAEPYIPLVLVNGRGFADVTSGSVSGQFYEGYNVLTNAYRSQYTTDNSARYYFLPRKNERGKITITYTATNGIVYEYKIELNDTYSGLVNSLRANIDRIGGYIYFTNSSGTVQALPTAGVNNNLEVNVGNILGYTASNNIISGMKFSTWFGGSRDGLTSGTRVFVAGHEEHPNLIHWSDLNNPLYFPENNYAYVGDAAQKITAFGKQSDMLIIFKEHELFSVNYVANNITTQDLIDNNIVDIASSAAVFPITQIHAGIGCDCPNTIQLCSNRLVWLTTAGKVYTLAGTNQNSERNVFELSTMIENQLITYTNSEIKNACACDWQNYYMLIIRNKAFLLNYETNSFAYITSYGDVEKAQNALSWYIWSFTQASNIVYAVSDGNECCFVTEYETTNSDLGTNYIYRALMKVTGEQDITLVLSPPKFIGAPTSILGSSNLSLPNHSLKIGDTIRFSGTPPYPLNLETEMKETSRLYVVYVSGDIFRVSFTQGGSEVIFEETKSDGWNVYQYSEYSLFDSEIESLLQTKVYDMNQVEKMKSINSIHIGIAGKSNSETSLSYLSDKGISEDVHVGKSQEQSGITTLMRFTPRLQRVSQFGIRLKCKGSVSINQLIIKYTARGGSVR